MPPKYEKGKKYKPGSTVQLANGRLATFNEKGRMTFTKQDKPVKNTLSKSFKKDWKRDFTLQKKEPKTKKPKEEPTEEPAEDQPKKQAKQAKPGRGRKPREPEPQKSGWFSWLF